MRPESVPDDYRQKTPEVLAAVSFIREAIDNRNLPQASFVLWDKKSSILRQIRRNVLKEMPEEYLKVLEEQVKGSDPVLGKRAASVLMSVRDRTAQFKDFKLLLFCYFREEVPTAEQIARFVTDRLKAPGQDGTKKTEEDLKKIIQQFQCDLETVYLQLQDQLGDYGSRKLRNQECLDHHTDRIKEILNTKENRMIPELVRKKSRQQPPSNAAGTFRSDEANVSSKGEEENRLPVPAEIYRNPDKLANIAPGDHGAVASTFVTRLVQDPKLYQLGPESLKRLAKILGTFANWFEPGHADLILALLSKKTTNSLALGLFYLLSINDSRKLKGVLEKISKDPFCNRITPEIVQHSGRLYRQVFGDEQDIAGKMENIKRSLKLKIKLEPED